jgi:hypothetical protein
VQIICSESKIDAIYLEAVLRKEAGYPALYRSTCFYVEAVPLFECVLVPLAQKLVKSFLEFGAEPLRV